MFEGKAAPGKKRPLVYNQSSRKDLPEGAVGAADIRVADLFDEDHCPRVATESFSVPAGQPRSVFTLARDPVSRILKVAVDGAVATPGWMVSNSGSQWSVPETREWVSLSPAPGATKAETVTVTYEYGGTVDVVASSTGPGPQFGSTLVWRSRTMCPAEAVEQGG